jgi:uncharacterized protein (DUF1330 family)
MKACVMAIEAVHDEAMLAEYRERVPGALVPFGGRFIARGGKLTMPEGQWQYPRTEAWRLFAAHQACLTGKSFAIANSRPVHL